MGVPLFVGCEARAIGERSRKERGLGGNGWVSLCSCGGVARAEGERRHYTPLLDDIAAGDVAVDQGPAQAMLVATAAGFSAAIKAGDGLRPACRGPAPCR